MRTLGRLLAARRRDETGSMIMVTGVIMVVTIGLVAVLLQVNSSLELSRTDQNRNNAFQFANAGVDQALFRIDSRTLPTSGTGSYTPTVVGGTVIAFTETLTVGGLQFQISATQSPPGQSLTWQVRSVGTDPSGRQRSAIATVQATPVFVNGFFTFEDFNLTGSQQKPAAYDSRVCPTASAACQLPAPIPGSLGTNSEISGAQETIKDFVDLWDGFNMYGRATQAAADQACADGDCGTAPKVRAITNQYHPPHCVETTTGSTTLPCGAFNNIPGVTHGCPFGPNVGSVSIAPGDYVCDSLNITGTVTVGGSTGDVRIWVSNTLTASSTAVVNRHQRTSRFQIFYPEKSTPTSSSICDAELWALLHTPGLHIDCVGTHQPNIYGAVIAKLHGGTGAHFGFHWDIASATDVHDGKYVVRNWRECPVGVLDC